MEATPNAPRCPSCGSARTIFNGRIPDAVQFAGRSLDRPLEGGYLWRCQTCTLKFRHPRLEKEALDRLYAAGGDQVWQTPTAARTEWCLAREYLTRELKSGRILDLGCFDGRFLVSLGPRWSPHGIELIPAAAMRASEAGIKLLGRDFAALDETPERFDVVTAFDVIEHVANPAQFLAASARVLRPGGLMIIATGNANSLPWRLLDARNLYCICPEHLVFINPDWCAANAARAGLEFREAIRYRRGIFSWRQRVLDLGKSVVFRAAPGLFAFLRRRGVGKLVHPAAATYPPLWPSARDHMLAVFEKAAQ